ncbi:ArsR/SmtB family transcription factor [Calidifontibacter terrae]
MTDHQLRPDVAQLRALGHPVRLRIIGLLRSDGPATATGLATRLGLNSGATSYHLRQLAQAGLIEDDRDRGDGRDRWWKASHDRTYTSSAGVQDPAALAALRGYHNTVVAAMQGHVDESVAERADLPLAWQDTLDASDWRITLTPAQADEVSERLHRVLDEAMVEFADQEHNQPDGEPDDLAPIVFHLHAFPAPGAITAPGADR